METRRWILFCTLIVAFSYAVAAYIALFITAEAHLMGHLARAIFTAGATMAGALLGFVVATNKYSPGGD